MNPMFRSFGNRMFVVILGLVVLIQGVTVVASLDALSDDAHAKARHELEVGERVFTRLIAERDTQLATAVRVLASDYGFKEAIATSDVATIDSVLENHGSRVKADLAAFIASDASVVTSTHAFTPSARNAGKDAADRFPFDDLLTQALTNDAATDAIIVPGAGAFQIVLTPVRVPEAIGWVCIGFRIDDSLAASFKELTNLDVSFAEPPGRSHGALMASTLRQGIRSAMQQALIDARPKGKGAVALFVDGSEYLTLQSALPGPSRSLVAILQTSLDQALAGYRDLIARVLLIFSVALLLAIGCARLVANSVTRPLRDLADAARRIAGGFYGEPIAMARQDEFGLLSTAFNDMQAGIAQREARIVHQAQHDGLTGLPNRLALRDRIGVALARSGRSRTPGALLLVDIVAFKAINDSLGHRTGDGVLQEISRRLLQQARAADTVARYGGNGFVLLLEGVPETEARQFARRILDGMVEPLWVADAPVRVDLTVGICLFPAQGRDAETLLRRAEIAMYAARAGHHPIEIYSPGQDEHHLRRLALLSELADALENDEMVVHYQPKVDLRTREVRQAEALVRWNSPTHGMIPPDEFIGLAEQAGLIGQLTMLVMRKVIAQIRQWTCAGMDITVSVNVSALDLAESGFGERVMELLTSHGVRPVQLILEMTEGTVIRDMNLTREVMKHLRDAGVRFSIDDFGTGYSSLAQLRSLPLHELKIDKSFVLNLPDSQEDELIVRSTVELAHNMGLQVCAEGVETEHCAQLLERIGCDIGQGFGFSRAMPADAFVEWLTAASAASARQESPARPGGTSVAGAGAYLSTTVLSPLTKTR